MKINSTKRLEKADGFTLVEILIAITIFAVGILGATSMQIMALQTNSKAGTTSEAYAVASEKMEQLLKMDYADINDDDSPETYNGNYNVEYNVSWNVQDNTPITNTKTITVAVAWNQFGNRSASITSIKGD